MFDYIFLYSITRGREDSGGGGGGGYQIKKTHKNTINNSLGKQNVKQTAITFTSLNLLI